MNEDVTFEEVLVQVLAFARTAGLHASREREGRRVGGLQEAEGNRDKINGPAAAVAMST